MKTARAMLFLALALLIASPLWAEGPKKKKAVKKAPPCPAAQQIERMLQGLTIADDQKAKLEAIAKEYGPKLMEMMKETDVLTPEQKKARAEAAKAAKEAGKKGKEAQAAIDEAVKLTDDQKAKQAEAKKKMGPLQKELREKVMAVLNDDQKEQLKKKALEAKKKPGK